MQVEGGHETVKLRRLVDPDLDFRLGRGRVSFWMRLYERRLDVCALVAARVWRVCGPVWMRHSKSMWVHGGF